MSAIASSPLKHESARRGPLARALLVSAKRRLSARALPGGAGGLTERDLAERVSPTSRRTRSSKASSRLTRNPSPAQRFSVRLPAAEAEAA